MNIAILDLETDPFAHGSMVYPFLAGFYDGSRFISYWGTDCVERMVAFLNAEKTKWTIYAHNGGRFDWFYFLPYIQRNMRIVNSRIIQAALGIHELRDSFAIMPFALARYKKTEIDYNKFKSAVRTQHRSEIVSYLRDDCVDLYTLCTAFFKEFGNNLTVGGTAMKELKKRHEFKSGNEAYDGIFRQHYYFGGRNQVFRAGVIDGPIQVYDVNSMYPYVMRDYLHPVSTNLIRGNCIDARTAYLTLEGRNYGAFATRTKSGSLDFTRESGIFHVTIHEWNTSQSTGTFECDRIHETIGFDRRESFEEFVTHFYDARRAARAAGDKIRDLFYKFILNSGYGKFAQNPLNYSDWFITSIGEFPPTWHECKTACNESCTLRWCPTYIGEQYIIWSKPIIEHRYYNIATGASITGASRAVLLEGLSHAIDPYYCDTDSIICRAAPSLDSDPDKLGAWKLETVGARAAICGKKLYAIYDDAGATLKKAHKGARLTGEEILRIAHGEIIESRNEVPSFKWDGSHSFITRKIRRTHPIATSL